MEMINKPLIVIVGPTASGKSKLAVRLAREIGGEVVSADSRQVYRGLDIGTDKIKKSEMKGVPHHLLDVTDPKENFTVQKYRQLAKKAIKEITGRGKVPILCGGTGFYIQAVVDGITIPRVPPNEKLREKLARKSAEELFQILLKLDPARAETVESKNPRRLIRAIEIAEKMGGVPKPDKKPIDMEVVFIGIKRPPEELRKLIKKRLKKWFREGLLEEVKNLHERRKLSWQRLTSFGLTYRYAAEYLRGFISRDEMEKILERKIWQYARHQMTWFKRDKRIQWVRDPKEAMNVIMSNK